MVFSPGTAARLAAAAVVTVAIAGMMTGCSLGSFCRPLTPTAKVTASFAPERMAIERVPGVVSAKARLYQPAAHHCVDRDSLATASWAAAWTVTARAGFTGADVAAVSKAVGTDTATISTRPGGGLSSWSLDVPAPVPTGEPLPGGDPVRNDQAGFLLATAAAARADTTDVTVSQNSMTVAVSRPAAVATAVAWLRAQPQAGMSWVSVSSGRDAHVSFEVSGYSPAPSALTAAVSGFLEKHTLSDGDVSGDFVQVVAPSKTTAEDFAALVERVPVGDGKQTANVFWPDGNGHQLHPVIGSKAGPKR